MVSVWGLYLCRLLIFFIIRHWASWSDNPLLIEDYIVWINPSVVNKNIINNRITIICDCNRTILYYTIWKTWKDWRRSNSLVLHAIWFKMFTLKSPQIMNSLFGLYNILSTLIPNGCDLKRSSLMTSDHGLPWGLRAYPSSAKMIWSEWQWRNPMCNWN
jgi:hypothetical protein